MATQIPGLREHVTPGTTGWLVEPESPRALAQALHAAMADRLKVQNMGEHARRQVQANDWSRIAERYLALYEETIAKFASAHDGRPDFRGAPAA
jgi:glycosyltransferase involved in cell wall biosynthesis